MNQGLVRRLLKLEEQYAKELERNRKFTITWWTADSGHGPGLRFKPYVHPEEEARPDDPIDRPPPVPTESTENDLGGVSFTDEGHCNSPE